ncbi:universal stress protein [Halobacillus campisalis]|uniref:Universal stress protein n=1 Tax=Halobacillus campisalis TaxID=435909 RepID=A0ABW2K596_9BACI|nr:universal stress protein [Halobacillus campisalis]
MNKILLVPFDASPSSERALRYAVDTAKEDGSKLIILNVQFDYNTRNVRRFATQDQIKSYLDDAARESFDRAEEFLKDSDVDYTLRKRMGIPDQVILEEASDSDADIIVMGTRGVGRVKGAILGSVSYGVLQSTTIPVTIVP